MQRIKNAPGYTEVIGQDLGIIGQENAADHEGPQTRIKARQGVGVQNVQLDFTKYSHQGVYIESRRNGGPWEFLGIDTESPYTDERPLLVAGQPEFREYRMRFWDKGTPNGEWIYTAKITVSP